MGDTFKPIESQEALDEIVKQRLERQEKTLEAKWNDSHKDALEKAEKYDELEKNYNDISGKYSELENTSKDFSTKISDLENQIKNYQVNEIKTKVAYEKGLSHDVIDRLRGETEEDIRKDADSLVSIIGQKKVPGKSSEETPKDSQREAMREVLAKMNLA